jgi:hypothetical protein
MNDNELEMVLRRVVREELAAIQSGQARLIRRNVGFTTRYETPDGDLFVEIDYSSAPHVQPKDGVCPPPDSTSDVDLGKNLTELVAQG